MSGIAFNLQTERELALAGHIWESILADNPAGQFWWEGKPYRNGDMSVVKINTDSDHPGYQLIIRCEKDY